jgi:diguanylate cyclase (GGDEF)-like protein/PAS domain S-box-containing protein
VRTALAGLLASALLLLFLPFGARAADPLQAISVIQDQERIEVTALGRLYQGRGDTFQVDTAPGPDGVIGRMSVRSSTPGTNPNWAVFALQNSTDKPIERWLTAERYTAVGSGIVWPDLDSRRIEAVTPSFGFVPERVKNDRADIFRITLDPGQTITYVAELSSDRLARIYLWKPLDYELKVRDRQLFNGILLGITGLLAIFLTAVFAANHKAIFPSAALVGWCVLAYLCVDFGFWHKLLQLRPEDNALYRAATEAAMAASFVIFLTTFLRLSAWHGFVRMLAGIWIAAQLALIAVAVIDPRLAATFARASFLLIGGVGAAVTVFLAVSGQDRALALVPSWLLLLVWIFGAAVTLAGRLSGDIFVSGLVAGLVLIIVLLGFTVTQFAFRSFEPFYGAAPSELQLRSLAIDGSGAAVWEWFARRDEIKVSPIVEASLGLRAGELSAKVEDFAKHLHPTDRERFRLLLWSMQERNGGNIRVDLRLRHADNSYRWFDLEAASISHGDRRALRCVGLMRDVTEAKRAQERLLHDAVHDSLTGLPNRELFLDRLGMAVMRAKSEQQPTRPTILFIDIDKFRSVSSSLGLAVGDSLLLTIARRLTRHLEPPDTLARVGSNQFAILISAKNEVQELAMFAERVRRSLRSPIKIGGKEIVVTGSTGIAVYDGTQATPQDLLREAEIAMYRAKRGGADRVDIFRPEMRTEPNEQAAIESDLRKALERKQVGLLYQPIIHLPTEELAGFEALVRWEHPRLGIVNPADFVSAVADSDLHVKLSSYVLSRVVQHAAQWQKELPRVDNPVFVSVNVSGPRLFHQETIQEVRAVLGRAVVPPGTLRLEIPEPLAMESPERAVEVLEWLRGGGAGLALGNFGTGYSSFAYLQRFPFDMVKIDQGLVQSCTGDGAGAAIVRSIVALAHELGKKIVADGVEGAEDVTFLRALGCEFAQGTYYGEPAGERETLQLLKTIRKSERKLQRSTLFRTKAGSRRKRRSTAAATSPAMAQAGSGGSSASMSGENASAAPPPLPASPSRRNKPAASAPPSATALLPPPPLPMTPAGDPGPPKQSGGDPPARQPRRGARLLAQIGRLRRKGAAETQHQKPGGELLNPAGPLPLQPNGNGQARPNGRPPMPPPQGSPRAPLPNGGAVAPPGMAPSQSAPPQPPRAASGRPPAMQDGAPRPPTAPNGAPPRPPAGSGPNGAGPQPARGGSPQPRPAQITPFPQPQQPPGPGPAISPGASSRPNQSGPGGPPASRASGSPPMPGPQPPGPGPAGAAPGPGGPPPAAAPSSPQFPALPSAIQASLAKLAGVPLRELPPAPPPGPPQGRRGPPPGQDGPAGQAPAGGRRKSGRSIPR